MHALLLGGGSIKGAFQVGAVAELTARGGEFDAIYGISVGALNAIWLADGVGRYGSWRDAAESLEEVWRTAIVGPESIGIPRAPEASIVGGVFGHWDGLIGLERLMGIFRDRIEPENVRRSGLRVSVGAVNIQTGRYQRFLEEQEGEMFMHYVLSSALTPVIMPTHSVGDQEYTDGGLRHVVPVEDALRDGVEEMTVIPCRSKPTDQSFEPIDTRFLGAYLMRAIDIMTAEIAENDIRAIPPGVPARIIYPPGRGNSSDPTPMEAIGDIMSFGPAEIAAMIEFGRNTVSDRVTV